jgi:cytosine deaminase
VAQSDLDILNARLVDGTIADLHIAAGSAARAIGRPPPLIAPGSPADLVLVRAVNAQDALVRRPRERIVIKAGRIVARDGVYLGDSGGQRGH